MCLSAVPPPDASKCRCHGHHETAYQRLKNSMQSKKEQKNNFIDCYIYSDLESLQIGLELTKIATKIC